MQHHSLTSVVEPARRVVTALDWNAIGTDLDAHGCAMLAGLLTPDECAELARRYADDGQFRSRVVMSRHGFGRGEYKYFAYPLPEPVASLRTALYPPLAAIANRWHEAMGDRERYPADHAAFLERLPRSRSDAADAAAAAVRRGRLQLPPPGPVRRARVPAAGGHPARRARRRDFTGGEFVLTEQRPRMQSRVEVVPLSRGDGVIFPVHHRPVRGTRGVYRVNLRHGVSRVRSGHRSTLGIIFHDAR